MKLLFIWSHLVDNQVRKHYFGDLIWYAINKRLHFDTHQKISFKLDVMLGLNKPFILILVKWPWSSLNDNKPRTDPYHLIVILHKDAQTFAVNDYLQKIIMCTVMCKVFHLHSRNAWFEQLLIMFFVFVCLFVCLFFSCGPHFIVIAGRCHHGEFSSSSVIHWNDNVAANTTSPGCWHKWINPISAEHLPYVSKTASVKCQDDRWVLLSCRSIAKHTVHRADVENPKSARCQNAHRLVVGPLFGLTGIWSAFKW